MTWLKIVKNGSNYYVSSNTILLEELTCMSIAILTLTRKVNAHEYYLLGYEKCKRTFILDAYLKFDICAALVRNIKYNIWMDKHIAVKHKIQNLDGQTHNRETLKTKS